MNIKSYLLLIKTNGDTDQVFTSNFSYLFLSVHSRRKLCTNLKSHLKLQTSELFLLLNTELQKNHFHSCHITKSYWINLGKLITQAFKINPIWYGICCHLQSKFPNDNLREIQLSFLHWDWIHKLKCYVHPLCFQAFSEGFGYCRKVAELYLKLAGIYLDLYISDTKPKTLLGTFFQTKLYNQRQYC